MPVDPIYIGGKAYYPGNNPGDVRRSGQHYRIIDLQSSLPMMPVQNQPTFAIDPQVMQQQVMGDMGQMGAQWGQYSQPQMSPFGGGYGGPAMFNWGNFFPMFGGK